MAYFCLKFVVLWGRASPKAVDKIQYIHYNIKVKNKSGILPLFLRNFNFINVKHLTEGYKMADEVILTKEGKEELEKRLEFLKVTKRAEITERIKTAREFGDLSENAEYDAAKNEQAMIEGEIVEIENKLKYAVIIKDIKKGVVSLGSKVDILDNDENELLTYEIVGTTEADVEAGRISNESPIGNALLGRKAGETFTVAVPAGTISITIKKVY